uniref:G9L homolog protein n=1 Tax=Abalone asfa-like virus TaxID=2839893 RepID=A0A5K7Y805_9VIRU|nr:g9L homolog protein [Abalone asfa-like virus]BCY04631.1 hypothetical protein [Abalone asfa-like virus]
MIIFKFLTVSIDVPNALIFCKNVKKNVLTRLQEDYEGKCYKGVYIISIERIEETSSCIMQDVNSHIGTINVRFLVKASVLSRFDIINSVKIHHNQRLIMGKATGKEPCDVILFPSFGVQGLQENQIVPVRIFKIDYKPMMEGPVATAVLLTCDRGVEYFRVDGELIASDIYDIKQMIHETEDLETARTSMDHIKCEKFRKLLHTYGMEVGKPKDGIDFIKMLPDIKDDQVSINGIFYQPLEYSRFDRYIKKIDKVPENAVTRDVTPLMLLNEFVTRWFQFNLLLNFLISNYDPDKNNVLWKIMEHAHLKKESL